MYYGRVLQNTNNNKYIVVITMTLVLLLSVSYLVWQPGSVGTSNCGCSWPGCGCLSMTLVPYDAPAPNFTAWAGVDVLPPQSPPNAQATVTIQATFIPPTSVPTTAPPTPLPQQTQVPIPTQMPFPTPSIFEKPAQ